MASPVSTYDFRGPVAMLVGIGGVCAAIATAGVVPLAGAVTLTAAGAIRHCATIRWNHLLTVGVYICLAGLAAAAEWDLLVREPDLTRRLVLAADLAFAALTAIHVARGGMTR